MSSTDQTRAEADRTAQGAKNEANRLAETARTEAQKLGETAKDVGRQQADQQFERGKHVVGDQVETVEHALEGAAKRLREDGSPLAGYASDLSSRLSSVSSRIESASVDDLAQDAKRLSRENPGLFMLGAVALGFAASRFLKASERADRDYVADRFGDDGYSREGAGRDRYGAYGGGYGAGYGATERYGRSDALGADPYRSPVASPASPRDDGLPPTRAPMDSTPSTATGVTGTATTSTAGTTTGTSTGGTTTGDTTTGGTSTGTTGASTQNKQGV